MKIFFVDSSKAGIDNFLDMGVENLLISYWYERQSKLVDHVLNAKPKTNIMLDSGGFSAWTQKKEINLDEYISYCKNNKDRLYSMVNLDVIGDAEQGFENFKKMKKAGLDVIPVFHRVSGVLDPIEHLHYYCENSSRIALAGYAQTKFKVREMINYTKKMFDIIPKDKKVHLLGLTNSRIIMSAIERITSVDSSSVSRRAAYSNSLSYTGMTHHTTAMPYRISKQQNIDLQRYATHKLLDMEKQMNEYEALRHG
jgi:hypothetical protein|tara:strand:- start:511 stop:1272 length:762 start_codon:yes stop_codon:yes gene_type:complete